MIDLRTHKGGHMNFNTVLLRLGIDPDNFINQESDPIKTDRGFIYEVAQKSDIRTCPYCLSEKTVVKDHDIVEINCSETDHIQDVLRIKKVRFKCKNCEKTFTPRIKGIEPYSKISEQKKRMILNDFTKSITFSQIAQRYQLSSARILQFFDENVPYVPRYPMPEVLCIDEIKFQEEYDQKYCCVLYDFHKKRIVDIIKNRQMPYLDEYFSAIPESERQKVRYFISDMYDGYATVCRRYFPQSTHIIDLFHVITQMTNAVNRLRVNTMNAKVMKDSFEYNFMKTHWKEFLCRYSRIQDKFFTSRKTGEHLHYDDLVFRCVRFDKALLEAYNTLQDLFKYDRYTTFSGSLEFIENIAARLLSSDSDILRSVGRTYRKWKVGIANGLAQNQNRIHYTNAIAESLNNQLQTIIKSAYGYHNFERFRKRALMIISYKKLE